MPCRAFCATTFCTTVKVIGSRIAHTDGVACSYGTIYKCVPNPFRSFWLRPWYHACKHYHLNAHPTTNSSRRTAGALRRDPSHLVFTVLRIRTHILPQARQNGAPLTKLLGRILVEISWGTGNSSLHGCFGRVEAEGLRGKLCSEGIRRMSVSRYLRATLDSALVIIAQY